MGNKEFLVQLPGFVCRADQFHSAVVVPDKKDDFFAMVRLVSGEEIILCHGKHSICKLIIDCCKIIAPTEAPKLATLDKGDSNDTTRPDVYI